MGLTKTIHPCIPRRFFYCSIAQTPFVVTTTPTTQAAVNFARKLSSLRRESRRIQQDNYVTCIAKQWHPLPHGRLWLSSWSSTQIYMTMRKQQLPALNFRICNNPMSFYDGSPQQRVISSGVFSKLITNADNDEETSTIENIDYSIENNLSSPILVSPQPQTNVVSVGIFIDLDNMSSNVILPTRTDVAKCIRPLKQLAKNYLNATNIHMVAFANRSTQTYKQYKNNKRKHDAESMLEQEYWEPSHSGFDDNIDDGMMEDMFPGATVQTGYDENGILRCGICGRRIKLTKKDRTRGWDEHRKLRHHMQTLHDREQKKRMSWLKQQKSTKRRTKVFEKLQPKIQKYKSAQVGLNRGKNNDWFTILREEQVQVNSTDNVDEALIKAANKWLNKQRTIGKSKKNKKCNKNNNHSTSEPVDTVVLMIVSEDSDFVPLLKQLKEKPKDKSTNVEHVNNNSNNKVIRYYGVSATWNNTKQTDALVRVSDIVVTSTTDGDEFGSLIVNALSDKGRQLLSNHNTNRERLEISSVV